MRVPWQNGLAKLNHGCWKSCLAKKILAGLSKFSNKHFLIPVALKRDYSAPLQSDYGVDLVPASGKLAASTEKDR